MARENPKELKGWLSGVAATIVLGWLFWVSHTLLDLKTDVAVLKSRLTNKIIQEEAHD